MAHRVVPTQGRMLHRLFDSNKQTEMLFSQIVNLKAQMSLFLHAVPAKTPKNFKIHQKLRYVHQEIKFKSSFHVCLDIYRNDKD